MSKPNKSPYLATRGELIGAPSRSFSEATDKLSTRTIHYLSPSAKSQSVEHKPSRPPEPQQQGKTTRRSENALLASKTDRLPAISESAEDDSFLRSKLATFSLKRKQTPNLSLPAAEKMDGIDKLNEIGQLDQRNPVELLEETRKERPVTCFCLQYCIAVVRYNVQQACFFFTQNPVFETISLMVIMANCVVLAMDDPTVSEEKPWQSNADYVFQALYTFEISLKIMALGFVFNEGAYLRDPWNVLDIIIVVFGYLSLFNVKGGTDLKALRTFRVLRPLRAISSVEGLRILISALVTSLPLLMDTIVILLFFFMIFAIAGLQLWHGILRSRCMNTVTGDVNYDYVCGSYTCGTDSICASGLGNPNYGATHFDDIFTALLAVFQCVTMEGWTDIQLLTVHAFGPSAVIFFTPLVLIGSFFLLNFTLAVIKSRVTDLYNSRRKEKQMAKMKKVVDTNKVLQHEAENKITVGQVLGAKYSDDEDGPSAKIMFLAQYASKTNGNNNQRQEGATMKNVYRSMLGFDELDRELLLEGSGETEIINVQSRKVSPILEDIISEEDENPLDTSSLQNASNSSVSNCQQRRQRGLSAGFMRSPATKEGQRTGLRVPAQKIEVPAAGQNRRFVFTGMLGIRRPVPPEVRVAFMAQEGLDEFSDTFFSQNVAPLNIPLPASNSCKDIFRQTPLHLDMSSSMVDFELSRLPSISKDATPANIEHETPPSAAPEKGPAMLPPEARQQFQSWRDIEKRQGQGQGTEGTLTRRGTVLREQNTMRTAVSTSVCSSVPGETARPQNMLSKFSGPTQASPPKIVPILAKNCEEEERRLLANQRQSSPQLEAESQKDDATPPKEELPSAREDEKAKWEAGERLREKYVLKDIDVLLSTSSSDVQPIKAAPQTIVPAIATTIIPPYKMKVRYEPTVLPEEEDEDEQTTARHWATRDESMSAAGDSMSRSMTSSRRASTIVSRGKKKKRSKSKSKKKSKKGRTGSESGSKRPAQSSVKDGLSNSNALQSTPRKDQDSISVAGSVLSSSRKSVGKDTATERGKNAEPAKDDSEEETEQEPGVRMKPRTPWSGQDVLPLCDPYMAVYVTGFMSEARVWKRGWEGRTRWARNVVKAVVTSKVLENVMNLLVIVNTVLLAMDRYNQPDAESSAFSTMNIIFTGIFAAEMVAKIFGLGLVGYLSDTMNYLDGAVVIFSLMEIVILDGQGALSAFRTLRVFRAVRMIRTLRVLRVARLLRSLRSMQLIIEVIGKTISSFAYIGLMLLILIFIYALFGMQLYGGKFDFSDGKPRPNFDSFNGAFLTMFQVLTMENWQNVLYSCMRVETPAISAIYLITWIFIGNYILLNLFLAIMLDAFTETDDAMDEDEEENSDELYGRPPTSRTYMLNSSGTPSGTLVGSGNLSKTGGSTKAKSQFGTLLVRQRTIVESDLVDDAELTKAAKDEEVSAYGKVKCEFAVYIFARDNPFRKFCWNICTSGWFEGVVILFICAASVKLAVDTYYLQNSGSDYNTVSYDLDVFFTVVFALEAAIKIVVYGFVFGPTTYLRDSWNVLDFFIVVASVVDTAVSAINIPMIKVLRLLRTFRPLRFITHNVNMRIIVTALFRSLGALLNTLIVIIVIWLMFSIVGVNFFAGKFQYCTVDMYQNSNRADCVAAGGEWRTYDHNFDNSINGLIFLFELTTQENWPTLMYQAIDCTDVDQGPQMDSQWYYAYYFVIFIFISSMFLLNLFVGVMFLNFTKVQKHETSSFGDIMVTEEQLNWIEVQKMIIRSEPNFNARTVPPQYNWRKPFHHIVTSTVFEVFIAAIILLNMVQMAMLYEDASDSYDTALDIVNYVFTGIFTVELVLKLIAFSRNFWYEAWNIFDFFIVVCSYVDIVFSNVGAASLRMLRIGPQLIRVLRVLRVSRLLRLVKKYKRLQDIMEIIQLCLPSMMNVFSLLALVLFIYAVLGCYLFDDVTNGDAINDFYNFSNFGFAIILCLKISTGEDWNLFMFDCARTSTTCTAGVGCGNPMAYIYFLTFKLVVTFVMLNLFILIVLQLFEKFFINTENIISKFKEDFENFQEHWQALGPSHSGFMINQDKLVRFFSSLPQPLGTEGMSLNDTTRTIIELGIRSNEQKNVFFNELLYCVMRRVYSNLYRNNAFTINKERETRRRILALAESAAKRGHYKTARRTFIKTANPFVSLMLLRLTVKLWRKYDLIHKKHIEEHEKMGELNYESSDEEEVLSPSKRKASSRSPRPSPRSRHQSPRPTPSPSMRPNA